VSAFSRRFQSTTSVFMGAGWWGLRRNLIKLAMYTLYGWNMALVPGVVYAANRLWHREWPRHWERLLFILLWILPVLAFYTMIHMGQQGLVFVFLPALLLLSAVGLERLLTARPHWLTAATAVVVALNAGIFCLAPEYPAGPGTLRLLSRTTLVSSDRYYEDRFEAIEQGFAPKSTAILAANWRHVEYYLPDYVTLPFTIGSKWEIDAGSPKGGFQEMIATPTVLGLQLDSRRQAAIVLFDPDLAAFNESPSAARELPLEHGGELEYFVLTEDQAFHCGRRSFGVSGN
jgi:hypothetical protein